MTQRGEWIVPLGMSEAVNCLSHTDPLPLPLATPALLTFYSILSAVLIPRKKKTFTTETALKGEIPKRKFNLLLFIISTV